MKNVCIIFLLSIIISLTALGFGGEAKKMGNDGGMSAFTSENVAVESEYLRIHIRADSNENAAQAVKYYVRDALVEYLTPLVAECHDKAAAMRALRDCLGDMERVAEKVLQEKGYSYGASVQLMKERFPTRVYDGYTLPAGEYTALIVRLGRGEGDNWWCVVYPPLCFAANANTDIVYKSKILEIINEWKNK